MRRGAILAGVWAAGVIVAVVLAFAAVAQVASGVAPNDADRMSQRAIDNELTGSRATSPTASPSTSTESSSSTSASTTPLGGTATTTTTSGPTTATTPTTAGGTPTTGRTTPTTWSSRPPASTATTDSTAPFTPPHNTVTTSEGGTVYTRCTGPDTIAYVAAVPRPGYERTVDVESPTGVHQSFANQNHLSNIEAECSNGVVHAQVEEESDDGG